MPDYEFIKDTGVIVPDTSTILQDVQAEYQTAFGADLDLSPSTPQGVLITAETVSRDAVVRNNAALANQINPNLAGGIFLDAICALTALERDKATKTEVVATLTGVSGTIIPAGVQAQTTNNDVFESVSSVTLVAGTADVIFQSVVDGPIPCVAGALNIIVDEVLGWEAITNAADGTLGTNQQTDQNLRALRKLTLAIQGVALSEAIISAVYIVPGVRSMSFRENVAATTQTIDGISMIAHSIYACVKGGTDADIAAALLENKSLGAGWNGSVVVTVVDAASGQSYEVKFARPTEIPIKVRTTVKAGSGLIDPVATTKTAIMTYADGELEGERGLVVGGPVSSFELAGAVNRVEPSIYVQKLEVSADGGTTWTMNEIPIAVNELATLIPTNIAVTVI